MSTTEEKANKKKADSQAGLERAIERIDSIATQKPSHKEVLNFLKEVVTEQFKIRPEIETHPVHLDEELIKTKSREGFPLVGKGDLKLDMASATTLFERLCEVLKRNNKVAADVDKIQDVIRRKEFALEEVFQKTAAEDGEYVATLLDRLELRGEILSFLTENSLKPIFEAYAHELKGHVDQESWQRGHCPICGSKPVMAELIGVEKKKFLICSCCAYEWRYMTIKCPFCETAAPEGFKYLFTEQEGRAYRIETCQKCRKYIKTVDTEELDEEIVPSAEDIGTLYLDVIAKKEGYEREVHPLGLNFADL